MANTPSPKSSLSHSLMNVVLVLTESVLTLLLRFDAKLRQAVYPLAKNETLVCVRTYLPHTQFYVTFGYKGILLDDELPIGKQQPDVIINAYSFHILGAILTDNPNQVDALQIRGEHDDVLLVKAFLMQLGIGGFIQNALQKIMGKPQKTPDSEPKVDKLLALKDELATKTTQLDTLNTENQKLNTQLVELQGKAKSLQTALIMVAVLALIAIVAHFFR